jgi:ABC-type nitrate/sulfonate/bicarbonate transport system ATPase subunit
MDRTELQAGSSKLTGIKNINIILGRNGAGKSRLLRTIDGGIENDPAFHAKYISPERAGVFQRDGNIMNNMERNPQWLRGTRRKNQADNFKSASANLLRDIETSYLRKLQDSPEIRQDPSRNFRIDRLDKINRLLANLSLTQEGSDFVFRNSTGELVQPDQISSGESEAVSLAAELMHFFENANPTKFNILLLDEPDVHLHPDLQARLAKFLIALVEELDPNMQRKVAVCVATHSTPFICALCTSERVSIGTKHFGSDTVALSASSAQLKKVAPFFGHPLSLSLSQDVMLILEGEDDERVWQQAARSSKGRIKLFPVLATSVDQQTQLESFCAPLLQSLYDSPIAFSLRDGDGAVGDLPAVGPVIRFRLQCYAIENLLLTDQALSVLGTSWDGFKNTAQAWLQTNSTHKDQALLASLVSSCDRLRHTKIKNIRQLICAISGSTKPWEVVVGQALGTLDISSAPTGQFDLPSFLGVSAAEALIGQAPAQ